MQLPAISSSGPNPRNPQRLTWQVLSQAGDTVCSTTREEPPWTWWPPLTPDVCALVAGLEEWDIPDLIAEESRTPQADDDSASPLITLGCRYSLRRPRIGRMQFYVCPRNGRSRSEAWRGGGLESYYCAAWGCETTGNTCWPSRSSRDLIKVQRNSSRLAARDLCQGQGWCNPLRISFTEKGKQAREWIKGRT